MKIKYFIALFYFVVAAGAATFAEAAPAFTREDGIRISSATPQAIVGSYPSLRMYALTENEIESYTSADGISWTEEAGTRLTVNTTPPYFLITTITGATVLALDAGGFRMLYSIEDTNGNFKIISSTSTDGLGWANQASTAVLTGNGTIAVGSPKLIELSNGNWRLYFVENQKIFTCLSTDEGVSWSTTTLALNRNAQEIAVSTLTDQRVRIVHSFTDTGDSEALTMRSALGSTSGTSLTAEAGVRLSTTSTTAGFFSFPLLYRSTDTFRWRMYYAFTNSASALPDIFSAMTFTPDPQIVTPSAVLKSEPTATLTINGEIFSPSPMVTVSRSGETDIVGTAVTRVDDQTITATIDTLDKTSGQWSVTVVNNDNHAGTLTNGLTVTFGSGDVVLINNILRPRENIPVQIHVRVNEPGRVHVRIYTLNGKFVRTISDTDLADGVTVLTWDGRNDDGAVVGSGTYVVKSSGPKLNDIQKIVVIR